MNDELFLGAVNSVRSFLGRRRQGLIVDCFVRAAPREQVGALDTSVLGDTVRLDVRFRKLSGC